MAPSKMQSVWLKLLGGKPEHTGLGVAAISFFVAVIGGAITFCASGSPEMSGLYWLGYAITVIGVLGGWCGIILHRTVFQRGAPSRRSDA